MTDDLHVSRGTSPTSESSSTSPTPDYSAWLTKPEKLFLTLPEAVAVSGLSAWTLRQAMIDGKLPCKREPRSQWTAEDRGWRIRRQDLEAL